MSIRNWLNQNPAVSTGIAGVVLVLCLGLVYMQLGGGGGRPDQSYYVDLNTNEIFTGEFQGREPEPIEAPSGPTDDGQPAGVTAYIHACGSCGDYTGKTVEEVNNMEDSEVTYLMRFVASEPGARPQVQMRQPNSDEWLGLAAASAQRLPQPNLECGENKEALNCNP
jgi:hypothetical protein